ncbi:MAG: M28 family peptidase [bacterium]
MRQSRSTLFRADGGKPVLIQIFLVVLFAVFFLNASPPRSKTPVADEVRRGFEAIRAQELQALLRFIAADELEGRNTGTRGLKIAARFLESQYLLAGLTPAPGQESMLQTFQVVESKLHLDSGLTVSVQSSAVEREFRLFENFVVTSQHAVPVQVRLPVLFAGFGFKDGDGHDDYRDLEPRGKILLVFDGSPGLTNLSQRPGRGRNRKLRTLRRSKAEWARAAGAEALFHINMNIDAESMGQMKRFLQRPRQRLAEQQPDLPQFIISKEVADAILAHTGWSADSLRTQMVAGKPPDHFDIGNVEIEITVKTHAVTKTTQNVVAYLAGSDPELKHEVVAFGAHYDHIGMTGNGDIFNGADDDGSGTVAILEIARAYAKNSVRPKRSLLFVSHAGEEKGLLGSRYYTSHPVLELENTVALLNIDMIGRNDPNSVYIIGSNFLSRELHEICEKANGVVALNLDYRYNDVEDPNRFYYRSDHYNYAKHGIPIIFYFSGLHEDYHRPTDTVDKIDSQKMQRIARLVYLTGWEVANLDHPLAKNGLLLE